MIEKPMIVLAGTPLSENNTYAVHFSFLSEL